MRLPRVKFDAKRLVELAVFAKKLVVVADVPVAFVKVKFWRVEEPVARKDGAESVVPSNVNPLFPVREFVPFQYAT